jgi:hypothetical protein
MKPEKSTSFVELVDSLVQFFGDVSVLRSPDDGRLREHHRLLIRLNCLPGGIDQ